MLLWVVYGLVGTIGLLVLVVFLRETWRAWQRRRFERPRTVCTRRLRVLKYLEPEDLAARLRAAFPLPVIEKCLEEFSEQSATSMREKLVQVNEDLGLVQARIEAVTGAGTWPERAAAAERLGGIGHSAAVLPLIATLQDQSEDKQVKSVASLAPVMIDDAGATPIRAPSRRWTQRRPQISQLEPIGVVELDAHAPGENQEITVRVEEPITQVLPVLREDEEEIAPGRQDPPRPHEEAHDLGDVVVLDVAHDVRQRSDVPLTGHPNEVGVERSLGKIDVVVLDVEGEEDPR